jgi:hypothetical protein
MTKELIANNMKQIKKFVSKANNLLIAFVRVLKVAQFNLDQSYFIIRVTGVIDFDRGVLTTLFSYDIETLDEKLEEHHLIDNIWTTKIIDRQIICSVYIYIYIFCIKLTLITF